MTVENDIQEDLALLNSNIMQAARIVALGKSEAERVEASKLYDELSEKRTRLKAEIEEYDDNKTDNTNESDAAPNPYERIADLERLMLEAANSGDMTNYSTMRAEKKELIHQHGRKPPVITAVTGEEISGRRHQQREQAHINRQKFEDEQNNPPARSFESEGDIELQMTAAAECGDHVEYGRLRRKRLKLKRA